MLIHYLHAALEWVLAVILFPFREFPPLMAVAVLSVLVGLLMLWVFGKFGDQERIRRCKERIRGQLLGIRLYQHDVGIVLRLQGSILLGILSYFRHSLAPLLVLLVPLAWILVQMDHHFSFRPLAVGESATVDVQLEPGPGAAVRVSLLDSEGLAVEAPPVNEPFQRRISWRVRADREGTLSLRFVAGDLEVSKELAAGTAWGPVSRVRTRSWSELLFFPGEPPLPDSIPVRNIRVHYPAMVTTMGGWEVHWVVCLLAVSVATAFLLKRWFGVEF